MTCRWCYIAKLPRNPGAPAICVDVPGEEHHTRRFVHDYTRAGYTVERLPFDEGFALFQEYDAWKRGIDPRQKALPL